MSQASETYFAYGSNLDPKRVERRLGKSKFLGTAKLPGHKLGFTGKSKTWAGSPIATATEDPASVTYGVCYGLSPKQIKKLDEIEGEGYSRMKMPVLLGDQQVDAWVYTTPIKDEPEEMEGKYIHALLGSYLDYGFPLTPLEPYLGEGAIRIDSKNKKLLRECIAIAGRVSGVNVLGKTRDRNYKPRIKIVREVMDGIEIAYMFDGDTNYLEGMNEFGIGIINSALMVLEDEKEKEKGVPTTNGIQIRQALAHEKLSDCTRSLMSYLGGIQGHTLIGNPISLYTIESAEDYSPIITKLDPKKGFVVRTNHGEDHERAGYTPGDNPEAYLSSKIRKAEAQVALADLDGDGEPDDYEHVMPSLTSQAFEEDSNNNMLRRTDTMRSTSQILMNLEDRELLLYLLPNECHFEGIEDKTPDDYEPKIIVRVIEYRDE